MPSHPWRTCTRCGQGFALNAKNFQRDASCKTGFTSTCKRCASLVKNGRRGEGKRRVEHRRNGEAPPRAQRPCKGCAGLTDRRPTSGCPVCRLPYQERSATSVADAHAAPHHAPRVFV